MVVLTQVVAVVLVTSVVAWSSHIRQPAQASFIYMWVTLAVTAPVAVVVAKVLAEQTHGLPMPVELVVTRAAPDLQVPVVVVVQPQLFRLVRKPAFSQSPAAAVAVAVQTSIPTA